MRLRSGRRRRAALTLRCTPGSDMDHFLYHGGMLHAEGLSAADLAREFGTPLYVYSKATLLRHARAFEEAFAGHPHLTCYAVKANSSLSILGLLARHGCGFDVVSKGEMKRVIRAGGDPRRMVFSGVGKSEEEIIFALRHRVSCINLESEAEAAVVERLAAQLRVRPSVALRVNPDVDARTHPAIATGLRCNKFGISWQKAAEVYRTLARSPHLHISGIGCHIGSQMTSCEPIVSACARLMELRAELQRSGITISHLDVGGGLGVTYGDEQPPSPAEYVAAVCAAVGDPQLRILIEPGRAMVANAGILLTRVLYLKENEGRRFCIVDAGMNDLLRPALYGAWMNIVPARLRTGEELEYSVVGPVCESDDFLGHERMLCVKPGDVLAVRGAGAYGSSMSSNYNSRPLCAEVLVDGERSYIIRHRQRLQALWADEDLVEV